MAIRRPSISSPDWIFQDFLYQSIPGSEERYLQVKWDGEPYTRVSQTFDYSNPPYIGSEQRGGDIVAQIDYTISGNVITINAWDTNWRDEWPLRLAVNYISQCLYPSGKGFVIFVQGQEVYTQDGEVISVADKNPYAFWASEQYNPTTNKPNDFMVRFGTAGDNPSPLPTAYTCTSSVVTSYAGSQILVSIIVENVALGTPVYWEVTSEDCNPAVLLQLPTNGVILINSVISYLKLPLQLPIPAGGPFTLTVRLFSNPQRTNQVAFSNVTVTG